MCADRGRILKPDQAFRRGISHGVRVWSLLADLIPYARIETRRRKPTGAGVGPRSRATSDDAANSLGEKNRELVWELWRNGDLAAAEIHARQAIRFDEQDAWAYFLLGCILVEAQRPHEAEAPMTRAVRLRPTKAAFHRKLGELFHHLGLASDAMDEERRYLESAEKCFRAAIRLNPEDAAAHCALALRLAGSMRHEEAERAYRTAVALEPEEPVLPL